LSGSIWKAWLFPGALLLGLAAILVNSSLLSSVAPSLGFYYFAVFAAGLVLAWRFNSSRVLFSLITLLLAHRAVEFFASGPVRTGPGRTAAVLVAFLIPLNYIVLALMRERGLTVAGIAPRFGILFLQSVVVAVLCRPENSAAMTAGSNVLPWWVLVSFAAGMAVLVLHFFQTRKLMETGFLWSLVAVLLWLNFTPIGKVADTYVATAGLILVASLIETSYVLAYHDELTGIRGRRAFNEALLSLNQLYAIAIVDIDHFKQFNDTYGHDVGDQVLRMVAVRLGGVGGGGQAFRCGGEEFAIIFRDTSAKEAFERLDSLRQTIQETRFRVRGVERRHMTRSEGPDRRKMGRKKSTPVALQEIPGELSVTVSIGVAEPSTRNRQPEQVINAADQALYRAKHSGRNRVEVASMAPVRLARKKRVRGAGDGG
jgi:diguanylate cyclase (GGDEF)-like protein